MKRYRCIKKLIVPELDDYEGDPTGNDYIVEVEETWNQEEESSVMLTKKDGSWLDIDDDLLETHFELVEESE